ncbi:pentatricopeptide repeat-containing protein [Dorcoceras hygrometricum]|uniref:Pentatricopeptide repeat-containing protein n=1 Tax=Dorcoceras hygrometricum TaxID=472368 RepID=A0A2Z7BJ34_9LAMI|nr:pentatricopeptide repeat-containing protein [Dorcoceras hygrometricum]
MILDFRRRNGEIELGTIVAKEIFEMESVDVGNYVQLAHCFASTAKWDGVGESWVQMRSLGLKKAPGWSSMKCKAQSPLFSTTIVHILNSQI